MQENNNAGPVNQEYWASADTRECADEIIKRSEDYWTFCKAKGWFTLWRRLYYAYNPNRYTLGQTITNGESNEYRTIKVNHFRNILEHIHTLSITDRPAWQPQSVNSDTRSQKQTIIAKGILDYYMRERRVERHLRDATRNALLFTEGFVSTLWDPFVGEVLAVDPDTNEEKREGDVKYITHEPVDVVRDPNLKAFHQRDWLVIRTYVNKYNLAEQYPEYKEDIVSQQTGLTQENHYLGGQFLDKDSTSDIIPLLTFYHAKTPGCPDGRQMELLIDGTVLSDSILLYEKLPVHRITPSDQIGTPMGMSVSVDLMPLQEMIDAHYTAILSINENYGIPKILLPIGSEISADNVSSGFQAISYNPNAGKPEILEMPTAPDGLFKAMIQLQHEAETLSGVNSVSRGNPESSLKSGSALALVQSMAIQFNQPLQSSYVQLLEDVGTATVQILKEYADAPRIIQIAGKRNRGIIQQEFTGEDIDSISRVQVQIGNPLSKTVSGRLSIAQDLLQNKIITTYQEYLMVLETGEIEPLTQGATAELLNLSSENEVLLEGKEVPVLFTDNHVLHIQEHTSLASDPVVRQDPELFGVISQHIMEHITMLSDPIYQNYRQLMNQPSFAPPMPQGMPGMPPPPPNQGPSATTISASGGPEQMMPPQPPMNNQQVQQKAASVKMPSSPKNAMTGQRPNLARPV
jgi:hypothetical protein